MIKLENVTVTFNENTPYQHKAIDNLSLEISEGEFIVVIGGNGAGKSSLLNVLAGNILPNKGKIFVDGINVTKDQVHERSKYISRVFQDPRIGTCADLTIEENFAIASKRGKSRTFMNAMRKSSSLNFYDLIASLNLGLEHRIKEPIGLLSGGQRQALSMLMSSLCPSKLLLLDEHTAALDPKMAKMVIDITNKIIEQKKLTTLMITHNMKDAAELGSRILVMQQGKIVHDIRGQKKKQICPLKLWEETQNIS